MRSVSVVIPNFNGEHLLEKNISAVYAALKNNPDFEVIVADDASTDNSVAYIEKNWPQVILIKNKHNAGFSKNINSGFEAAQKELMLALNSDVILAPDYFEKQWDYFSSANTFGVMGSIYNGDKLIDAAKYPEWKAGKLVTTLNVEITDKTDKWLPTLFLSGANALMDRKKVTELGGMDEIYSPFYMEDVDLSVRAQRMGWACYYEPKAKCYHLPSSTIENNHKKTHINFISKRNKLLFHFIHLSGFKRLLWQLEIVLNLLFRWLSFSLNYYKTYFSYLKNKPSQPGPINFKYSLQEVVQQILFFYKDQNKKIF